MHTEPLQEHPRSLPSARVAGALFVAWLLIVVVAPFLAGWWAA